MGVAMNISVILEIALTLLLLVTLGYCVVLERRLAAVNKGQQALGNTVRELNYAIERAGTALSSLRSASGSVVAELNDRVKSARSLADELSLLTASGERIAERFDRAISAKQAGAATPPSPSPSGLPSDSIMQRLEALRTVR